MFTGSTEVARLIQRQLATRLSRHGRPIPLIAETGGQNAMIVDSSALAEQVVADVIASAFDSAGQRCSALRVLCLQEDIADRTLTMLKGALAELSLGRTDALKVDIGPVITAEAQAGINAHIDAMRAIGRTVDQRPLPPEAAHGTFVAPTIIAIDSLTDLDREVFGPVLHVLRFRRDELDALVDAINATGYGLTFGFHTRLDETVARVTSRVKVGNIYINRNVIGAIVGVQPFGGCGRAEGWRSALSGTAGHHAAGSGGARQPPAIAAPCLCRLARCTGLWGSRSRGAPYRRYVGTGCRTDASGAGRRAQSLHPPSARGYAAASCHPCRTVPPDGRDPRHRQ